DNLRQPQMRLKPFDFQRLLTVAQRVVEIYPADNGDRIRQKISHEMLGAFVDRITRGFGGRIDLAPRLFLRELVHVLDLVDQHASYDPARDYRFETQQLSQIELHPEEERALGQTQTAFEVEL